MATVKRPANWPKMSEAERRQWAAQQEAGGQSAGPGSSAGAQMPGQQRPAAGGTKPTSSPGGISEDEAEYLTDAELKQLRGGQQQQGPNTQHGDMPEGAGQLAGDMAKQLEGEKGRQLVASILRAVADALGAS